MLWRTGGRVRAHTMPVTAEIFKTWMNEIKEATGVKGTELYHPVRIALTGAHSGPGLRQADSAHRRRVRRWASACPASASGWSVCGSLAAVTKTPIPVIDLSFPHLWQAEALAGAAADIAATPFRVSTRGGRSGARRAGSAGASGNSANRPRNHIGSARADRAAVSSHMRSRVSRSGGAPRSVVCSEAG